MKITHGKFFKYLYTIIIAIWGIITLHIFYLFIFENSEDQPVEGGTYVHGVVGQIGYIPYLSNSGEDKFFQSLMFDGCLEPYVSGTDIKFSEKLCNVSTNNYREFELSVKDGIYWQDGEEVTTEDIYFTFNDVIKNNKRNLQYLNNFNNIEVEKNNDTVNITFPNSSIDNHIILSEFLLPKHILEGTNTEEYIQNFASNPIGTSCGRLQAGSANNNITFDLSSCEKASVEQYQVQSFNSWQELEEHAQQTQIIDSYIGDKNFDGYRENKVILNNFLSLFFNIQSEKLNSEVRKSIGAEVINNFYQDEYENYLVKDRFLFDTDIEGGDINQTLNNRHQELTSPTQEEKELPELPEQIEEGENEYYLSSIDDTHSLTFNFTGSYDSVSVQAGEGAEYQLQSYEGGESADYNIAERFGNVQEGENNYIVRGYQDGQSETLSELTVHYQEKPTIDSDPEYEEFELDFVYQDNDNNKFIKNKIQKILEENEVKEFFNFEKYDSYQEFQDRLESGNYDVAIRGIQMGLKKDISNIFLIENPIINPSRYINNEIASNINNYFITEGTTREELLESIHNDYKNEVPFLIFGKELGQINIKENLDISFPKRLYDYWFKKENLGNINTTFKRNIHREDVFSLSNFYNFLIENLD
ncbi:ABC transporter substrate-binding protein [Candidatus Absconditicoccus praedator]|uniref:ABC transporter substrate-binding protein n=1 Tax=Candidatus Absconditicoccus praedator TaxID=2735562 RepID=UPI001E2EC75B|nr:ABC transporter substrate-binding protein [Candidatus Absconditicoccus praedator]UFX83450.1 hypothetical protein HLG78_04955 [Candidatus Absconditicoccus praedator]